MNKTTSIILAVMIVFGTWFFVSTDSNPSPKSKVRESIKATSDISADNTTFRDGFQYVAVTAKGGYFPSASIAKAGIPTKLIVKTTGTYDCSSLLVIRSLKYRNILPSTGETEIALGTFNTGDVLQGSCGMGMYNFSINFN